MKSVILVPVKDHALAKSRMSSFLSPQERSRIAGSLLEDLVRSLRPLPYRVAVATNSQRAAELAGKLGWEVIWEDRQISESASVDAASVRLASEGVEAVLRIPADLPRIQSRDVTDLFARLTSAPCAVMVPSRDRAGTNALLRTPPLAFPSRFGPGSFKLHAEEAARAGVQVVIVENPRRALDLDDAADIGHFLSHPADCETYRTLIELNVKERLARDAIQDHQNSRPGTDP